jgi:hypothetical protein
MNKVNLNEVITKDKKLPSLNDNDAETFGKVEGKEEACPESHDDPKPVLNS